MRRATKERAIGYPVAVDNDYAIWSAFANRYWPALYFADRDGIIRDHHFGEGRYEKLERVIQQLLGVERQPVAVEGLGVEAAADWDDLRTPETYLGYSRSDQFGSPPGAALDHRRVYTLPEGLRLNHWALAGEWTIRPEYVVLDQAGGSIAFRFHARDAHVVLSRGAPEPIPFRVFLDGEAPGRSHGVDVDEDGHGVLRRLAACISSRASTTLSVIERSRSPSSSQARRRTRSPSGSARPVSTRRTFISRTLGTPQPQAGRCPGQRGP